MPTREPQKKKRILLIEDNEEHLEFIRDAVDSVGFELDVQEFDNGRNAIAFIDSVESHDKPDIIILDWNMIGSHGRHIMKAIRGNAATKITPVAVFTTSDDQSDINEAHALGCNVFGVKPALFTPGVERTIEDAVVEILNLWLRDDSIFRLPG